MNVWWNLRKNYWWKDGPSERSLKKISGIFSREISIGLAEEILGEITDEISELIIGGIVVV